MTKKVGRPTLYDEKIAKEICDTVASSTLGLRKLCKIHNWPDVDTIFQWRYKNPEFADQYDKAKAHQAGLLAEEIIDIADDGLNDTYVNDDGKVITDSDVIQRSRLRVDARKWVAARLLPKVYGDKQQVETTHRFEDKLCSLEGEEDE